jgi:hypothetical protein
MLRRGERLHTVVYTGGRKRAAGEAGSDAVRDDVDPDATTTASGGAGRSASGPGAGEGASTGKVRSGGGNRPDDALTHIFGCPYCYPANEEHPRYCPVCERKLGPDDYVIARMFTRAPRSHVHVLGCTLCRGPGSRARRM